MKRYKPILRAILLVAILACLLAPSSALAATGMSYDNHTDTDDYCMRAHDVTIQLSEFTTKSRSQLESDIISASAFAFLLRDTANPTGMFVPFTSGYTVDFSNLVAAASTSGYVVTVTLPAVTLFSPSQVSFRVFVEDDTPQSYSVTYAFVSGTAGQSLPAGVLVQTPASASVLSGTTVTPASTFSNVRDGAGRWTFSGWSPASQSVTEGDVSFIGTWNWTVLPIYAVDYRFVSTSSGHSLPSEVLAKLPSDTSGVDGDVFSAPSSFHSVEMGGGYWRFQGWTANSQTIAGADIVFTGSWRWHANSYSATNTPEPSESMLPIATPAPSMTIFPTPTLETPAPTQAVIQVLEQTQENPPPTSGGSAGGGAGEATIGQVAAAGCLSVLVATQAFAVAGDVKVLNWYKAKKASLRRTKA